MSTKKHTTQEIMTTSRISAIDEQEKLRRDIYRPDIEKLHLFTQMLRVNALFKKAKIIHK